MSEFNIETIEALRKLQEKQVPDAQEEYDLLPNGDEKFHRVALPTYAQVRDAEECRFKRPRQDQAVIEQISQDYGWKKEDMTSFDTQLDYYKAILPIVCLEPINVNDDFSPMESDRMISDFFTCAFY